MDKAYDEDKFSDEDSDEKRSVDSDVIEKECFNILRYLNLMISWIFLKRMRRQRREMKVPLLMRTNRQ